MARLIISEHYKEQNGFVRSAALKPDLNLISGGGSNRGEVIQKLKKRGKVCMECHVLHDHTGGKPKGANPRYFEE